MREKRGITLIALVVTIVVLLILAGVSISMLSGENGIITQAQTAKLETRGAEVEERVNIWKTEYELLEYSSVDIKTENEFIEDLKEQELVFDDEIDEENKIIEIGSRKINYGIEEELDDVTAPTVGIAKTTTGANNLVIRVSLSEVNDADYPITIEYYRKLASASDETYEKVNTKSIAQGTTEDSNTYTDLSESTSYTLKVKVIDNSGNAQETITTAGTSCFLAGTQVLTENGLKNIEEIQIGEKVYSINLDNNQRELKEVTAVFSGKTDETYEITIGDETVKATPKHQFYVVDKGWVRAYDLQEGDKISSKDNEELVITKIEHKFHEEPIPVYNLTVEGYHNYLITGQEFLVHNALPSAV